MRRARKSDGTMRPLLACFCTAWLLSSSGAVRGQNVYLDIITGFDVSPYPDYLYLSPELHSGSIRYHGTASYFLNAASPVYALVPSVSWTNTVPRHWYQYSITNIDIDPPGEPFWIEAGWQPQSALPPGDYHIGTFNIAERSPSGWVHPPGPVTFGVFIGRRQEGNGVLMRGDLDAARMREAVANNLPNVTLCTTEGNPGWAGMFSNLVKPGDKLFVYASLHGGRDAAGPETTATPGNEWLPTSLVTTESWGRLSDDSLAQILANGALNEVEKWVFLDACYAGGFWGNNDPMDVGDLEKLPNIGFLGAAPEDGPAYFNGVTGLSYFGTALTEGISKDLTGNYLNADLNRDTVLTFDELTSWMQNYSGLPGTGSVLAYEKGLGDPVSWSPDLWRPVSFRSDDFTGTLGGPQSIPAPGAIVLGCVGVGVLGCIRRRYAH